MFAQQSIHTFAFYLNIYSSAIYSLLIYHCLFFSLCLLSSYSHSLALAFLSYTVPSFPFSVEVFLPKFILEKVGIGWHHFKSLQPIVLLYKLQWVHFWDMEIHRWLRCTLQYSRENELLNSRLFFTKFSALKHGLCSDTLVNHVVNRKLFINAMRKPEL